MKRKWLPMFFLFLMCGSPLSADDSTEKLPELIEGIPARQAKLAPKDQMGSFYLIRLPFHSLKYRESV